MPYRRLIFANNEIYHVFNQSVNNEQILKRHDFLKRGLSLMDFYRFPTKLSYSHFIRLSQDLKVSVEEQIKSQYPLVSILGFSFMPNHFHMQVQQIADNGISIFISQWQNSFAKYFNIKMDRKGSLFLEMFKGRHIETRQELIHVSRYIHLNPVSSFLINIEELACYPFTSFPAYIGTINYPFVNKAIVLGEFKNAKHYKKFVHDQADYQRTLQRIKNLIFG